MDKRTGKKKKSEKPTVKEPTAIPLAPAAPKKGK